MRKLNRYFWLFALLFLIGCEEDSAAAKIKGTWIIDKQKTLAWISEESNYTESRRRAALEAYSSEYSVTNLMRVHFKGDNVKIKLPDVEPIKWTIKQLDERTYLIGDSKLSILNDNLFRIDSLLGDGSYQTEFWMPYAE